MHNAMLDRLPEDYNGWLIRTDYRIGVQIQLCISDPELDESERTWTALSLLYGNGIPPDLHMAIDGLSWFMSGRTERHRVFRRHGDPQHRPVRGGQTETRGIYPDEKPLRSIQPVHGGGAGSHRRVYGAAELTADALKGGEPHGLWI